ncbi:HNH endonuclease [Maricaulis sp.]|uniref:HNH endonuclease n=1 Tax=Maricaulis sp. TaxID=1486257 RepID=UPI003A95605C
MTVDPKILKLCENVTAKRARTVIDHILQHGSVNNEELQDLYGYTHGPRAARDVREQGIPLDTIKVVSETSGRKIGAYIFGDPTKIKKGRIGGRKAFSKSFKDTLLAHYGSREAFTNEVIEGRYLQIDHRIPYEVAGDEVHDEGDPAAYMLLDASSQRAKSWSCEACKNWQTVQDQSICKTCMWAFPEAYDHIAMQQVRRVDLQWQGDEVAIHDTLKTRAVAAGKGLSAYIKELVKAALARG